MTNPPKVQTIGTWLSDAQNQLQAHGIVTARLDALVLLEDATKASKAWLLAHPEIQLDLAITQAHPDLLGSQVRSEINVLNATIEQRCEHMPLAYVRGRTEFYGREFKISPAVLEPRPESETMIDMLLKLIPKAKKHITSDTQIHHSSHHKLSIERTVLASLKPRIADVGTGSGALGITAQLELPDCSVDLLDIDPQALTVAKMNVVFHTLSINVILSDMLAASRNDYDVLICNLPYVPDDFHINLAATHEPRIAIFGGPDGLDCYRSLFSNTHKLQHKPLYILTESLPTQHSKLTMLAEISGYKLIDSCDFIQAFQRA